MRTLKIILALGIALSALAGTQASAGSFKAAGAKKTFSRTDRSAAMSFAARLGGGGGGPLQATSTYCVWQDAGGNWKAKRVDLLTICINSIKVTCTDGQCST